MRKLRKYGVFKGCGRDLDLVGEVVADVYHPPFNFHRALDLNLTVLMVDTFHLSQLQEGVREPY